jgi:hypothetical protein
MYYTHLRNYHTKVQPFEHPLLNGAPPLDIPELNRLAEQVLDGGDPVNLIMALRRCVSLLVGRFLANHPETYPFLEDMVSQAMTEITRLCHNIPLELFEGRGILVIATSRAQFGIENMLNKLRGLAAPGHSTQKARIKRGEKPIYVTSTSNDYTGKHPESTGDQGLRDILDVYCKLKAEGDLDQAILSEENWGRKDKELAEELGVHPDTVRRRRRALYNKYLELKE